ARLRRVERRERITTSLQNRAPLDALRRHPDTLRVDVIFVSPRCLRRVREQNGSAGSVRLCFVYFVTAERLSVAH
ncbi:hypothetical protein PMAYCL1PPCAC_27604, partial [Pristionchus mayeri]